MSGAAPIVRVLAGAASPAGPRGRLSILIFHRVLARPDPLMPGEPTVDTFRQRMDLVRRTFKVLPLGEASERLAAGTLPARAACITFDDGYRDNRELALPVLRELGLTATFFVATGYLDGGIMWNDRVIEAVRQAPEGELDLERIDLGRHAIAGDDDRRNACRRLLGQLKYLDPERREATCVAIAETAQADVPTDLMMTSADVRALHDAGMAIGGHTRGHPILARVSTRAARDEIGGGKETLDALLGEPIRLFAYPNGVPDRDYTPRDVDLVREAGFECAVSTSPGAAARGADPLQLPRFTPWDRPLWKFGLRMVANLRSRGEVATAPERGGSPAAVETAR